MACTGGDGELSEARANLVLVSIDTLRADRLGAYGYRARATTPRLDEVARRGALFETHISASPWTTPSHLSLFTGLSPARHGVMFPFSQLEGATTGTREVPTLSPRVDTLASRLRKAGYRTAAFTGGGAMAPELGFGRGFDRYETNMLKVGRSAFREMLAWASEEHERPFFLFWHTYEAHAPYLGTDYLSGMESPGSRTLSTELDEMRRELVDPVGGTLDRSRTSILRAVELLQDHGMWRPEVIEALYDGSVASADRWVGRLLDFLRREGLESDTVLVITSDHGEEFREHTRLSYDAHGHTVYEELIRVPLLIRFPGEIPAGLRVEGQTRSIDLLPTLLDLLGLPWRPERMEGRSLAAGLREGRGPTVTPPSVAVSEALAMEWEAKSARTDEYKYIVWIVPEEVAELGREVIPREPARRELYHLESDPGESLDLLKTEPLDEPARRALRTLDSHLRSRVGSSFAPESETLRKEDLERLRTLGYLNGN